MVKFPEISIQDEALWSKWSTAAGIQIVFAPWFASVSSVYTLKEEGLWSRIEGVSYHLWSVDLFHKMVSSFAELLEVDMNNDLACFSRSASLKVRLLGGDMPSLVHFFSYRRLPDLFQ